MRIDDGHIDLPFRSPPPPPPPGYARLYADENSGTLAVVTQPGGLALRPETAPSPRGSLVAHSTSPGSDVSYEETKPNPPTRLESAAPETALTPPGKLSATAHADSHAGAGSDPLSPAAIGAAARLEARFDGIDSEQSVLAITAHSEQSAALQSWRSGDGSLASIVTSDGAAFFRELGLASDGETPLRLSPTSYQDYWLRAASGSLRITSAQTGSPEIDLMRFGSDHTVNIPGSLLFHVPDGPLENEISEGYIDIPVWTDSAPLPSPLPTGLRILGGTNPNLVAYLDPQGSVRMTQFGSPSLNPGIFCAGLNPESSDSLTAFTVPWFDDAGTIVCDSLPLPRRP